MQFHHEIDTEGFNFAVRLAAGVFLFGVGIFWTFQYGQAVVASRAQVIERNTASVVAIKEVPDISLEEAWRNLYFKTQVYKLGFVGDIMLDRDVKRMIGKYGEGSYDFPFLKVKNYFSDFDVVFGNLEGPISDKGRNVGSIYSFRMDPKSAEAIKNAGFSIVSFANNHVGDWGFDAFDDTLMRLSSVGVHYVGAGKNEAEAYAPKYMTLEDGTKIGFLAYTEFSKHMAAHGEHSGIAIISESAVEEGIKVARENADIVVVSFHYGTEYKPEPNDFQERISKFAVSKGADLVVGHHPHVVEPLVSYRNGYIAYSLGNFIFDQYFSKETMEGGFLYVEVQDKKIIKAELKKVEINKTSQPFVVEEKKQILDVLQ